MLTVCVANCVSLVCGVVTLSVVSSSTCVFVDELETFGSELWFKYAGFIIALAISVIWQFSCFIILSLFLILL
jgi:hypothetical protein